MYILGISCFYHDSSAVLMSDGQIIAAAQEERFTRVKHDNSFPLNAITFCLDTARIAMNEISIVAFYEKPIIKFDRVLEQHIKHFPKSWKVFVGTMPNWLTEKIQIKKMLSEKCHFHGSVQYFDHHLCHAASAYYTSPFSEATIVTIDGVGESTTTAIGSANQEKITLKKRIIFPDSLGLFYSTMTSYLGFAVNNDEYKVMGLAAYGNWRPYYKKVLSLIDQKRDGSFRLASHFFAYSYKEKMYTKNLEILLGRPARNIDSPMTKQYQDIAASTQKVFEQVLINILNSAYKKHPSKNLILSGGSALNSLANGIILKNTKFKQLYITPDPGDGGGSLGACLLAWHKQHPDSKHELLKSTYLGPEYDQQEIIAAINKYKLNHKLYSSTDLLELVSDYLINNKVIGWFQGRMEWGPRALGNRSILASATDPNMKDIINSKVKHREMFRPFAPAILREYTSKYFICDKNLPISSDYMLLVYPFKKEAAKKVPSVVHVDGTGRLQTVDRKSNPKYYDLIDTYRQKTGIPLILNTSFNVKGEPIVCIPEDAIKCFLNTDIDYLVIGNYIINK